MDFLEIRRRARERAARRDAERPEHDVERAIPAEEARSRGEDPPEPRISDVEALEIALEAQLGPPSGRACDGQPSWEPPVDPRPHASSLGADETARATAAPGAREEVPAPPGRGDVPADPLADFFFSDAEAGPELPELGLPAPPRPNAIAQGETRREYLTFRLGTEEYGLEIEHVREILKPPPITEVPRASADVLGVITVRGEVIPIFDLGRRLHLPAADAGTGARVVVCDAEDRRCGLLVDGVSDVVKLAPSAIEPNPQQIAGMAAECLTGIGRQGERLYMLIDAHLLLRGSARAPDEAEA